LHRTGFNALKSYSTAAILPNLQEPGIDPNADHHAVVSTFDLFSIGVGPSSSHTVGPMRAAKIFIGDLEKHNLLERVHTLRVGNVTNDYPNLEKFNIFFFFVIDMFGSLALTGKGHGTPEAILMGIEGESPDTVETSTIKSRVDDIHTNHCIHLNGTHRIHFNPERHLIFNYFKTLPQHPNGLRFCAYDTDANMVATNEYFSIGGGFVVNDATQLEHGENVYYKRDGDKTKIAERSQQDIAVVSLPFRNAEELLQVCKRENMTIAQVVFENELKWSTPEEIRSKLLRLWNTMDQSIKNGVMASEKGNLFVFYGSGT
jgi:hypothetical protein